MSELIALIQYASLPAPLMSGTFIPSASNYNNFTTVGFQMSKLGANPNQ